MAISDEIVSRIWNRPDLSANEKTVLIDIHARTPDPEKVKGSGPLGQTEYKQGMALATVQQIATRTGLSETVVKKTIKALVARKLLQKKASKGRTPSAYLVVLR